MNLDEETSITEITILPDGRIFVFGASREVLEVLDDLKLGDETARERAQLARTLRDHDDCDTELIQKQKLATPTETGDGQTDEQTSRK